ncbi:MAG: BPL-N domain-containing protein [Candidatus Brocadiia bacterium]
MNYPRTALFLITALLLTCGAGVAEDAPVSSALLGTPRIRIYPRRAELVHKFTDTLLTSAHKEFMEHVAQRKYSAMDVPYAEVGPDQPYPPTSFTLRLPIVNADGTEPKDGNDGVFDIVGCKAVTCVLSSWNTAKGFAPALVRHHTDFAKKHGYRLDGPLLLRLYIEKSENNAALPFEGLSPMTPVDKQDFAVFCGSGVTGFAVMAASSALWSTGATVFPVSDADFEDSRFLRKCQGFVFPSGNMNELRDKVTEAAMTRLRDFIQAGGIYIGFCAGAYLASSAVRWNDVAAPSFLALFGGTAVGPIAGIGANSTVVGGVSLTDIKLFDGISRKRQMAYFQGPWFDTTGTKDVTVLATYDANEKPAIIALPCGRGRVVLCGPNLEFDLTSNQDGFNWPESSGVKDPECDWDVIARMVDWAFKRRELGGGKGQ